MQGLHTVAIKRYSGTGTYQGNVMRLIALVLFIFTLGLPLHAQESSEASELDSVEVTGSRISYKDLVDTPAISITKQGDYLLQKITLINDTRSEEGRKQEIYATIEKMLSKVGTQYQLLSGEGYRAVLTKNNYKVELNKDSSRPDVSRAIVYIRTNITGSAEDGEKLISSLRSFARDTQKIGRTEVEVEKDTALGMNKPERYRYEVISAIAQDSKKITKEIGVSCEVKLGGLNSRIEWERVSATELLLYIRYSMDVSGCGLESK
jgi:hypothetical protein